MAKQWQSALLLPVLFMTVLGCAKRNLNPLPFAAGYAACSQSNLGQFQVTISQSQANIGVYAMSVAVNLVPTPGKIVRIALVTSAGQARDLSGGVTLSQNSIIFQGTLTP